MTSFKKALLTVIPFVLVCNISVSQNIQSMDSVRVSGYLIASEKNTIFYYTKDSIFDVDILNKKMKNEETIQYIDPIDIKRFMSSESYDTLKKSKNPFSEISSTFFRIKSRNRLYTIYYIDRFMLKIKTIDLKGRKIEYITFPFYR